MSGRLTPGAVFAGYQIEGVLGSGGMGTVYLARHPRLPRREAVKVLSPQHSSDDEFRARFVREAELAARLDHPNIIAVHDRGVAEDLLWIAMQYVDGGRRRRTHPAASVRAGACARRRDRDASGTRAGRRPSSRDAAPGCQTGEPAHRGTPRWGRVGVCHRFRHRESRRIRDRAHRIRRGRGDVGVCRTGTTRRAAGGSAGRRLCAGLHPVRTADRSQAVPPADRRRGTARPPPRPAAAGHGGESGAARSDRRGGDAGIGERPGAALSDLRCAGGRGLGRLARAGVTVRCAAGRHTGPCAHPGCGNRARAPATAHRPSRPGRVGAGFGVGPRRRRGHDLGGLRWRGNVFDRCGNHDHVHGGPTQYRACRREDLG
ncbi:protein kinase [Nocardia cyriacigeorgica]|nr:protein kinase [Nocardia cyriacigeorgica]